MKLVYYKCEVDYCKKQASIMVRDKNDYFIAVCPKCAEQLKKSNRRRQRKSG